MNLVGYTATALSSNDITDTPKDKNVVGGAIVELKTLQGDLVTIYDDSSGTNPETQKACDSDGQCTFYAEDGDYNLEINGKPQKINLFFNKDKVNDIAAWGERFVGYFVDGFTYTKADDVAKGVDGKYHSYSGASAYPVVVSAGTVPSDPEYTPAVLSDAENIKLNNESLLDTYLVTESGESSEVSAVELTDNTGWNVPAGWSGDYDSGFEHADFGGTNPLTKNISISSGKFYEVVIRVVSPTSSKESNSGFEISLGGSGYFEMYEGNFTDHIYNRGIQAGNDNTLISIKPENRFDGTITEISVKEITGETKSLVKAFDSNGLSSLSVTPTSIDNENVFLGTRNAVKNTQGKQSVGIGFEALMDNTTGFWNVAMGRQAMRGNTVGSRNVAIGYITLRNNKSGHRNIALGSFCMESNTDGHNNIALGADVMQRNETGWGNIALGLANLSGSLATEIVGNVAIGHNSMPSCGTDYNVGVGFEAGYSLQTGNEQIAIGRRSARYVTVGSRNLVIGHESLDNVNAKDLDRNLVIGSQSGKDMIDGADFNILIGHNNSNNLTTGDSNIYIGYNLQAHNPTDSFRFSVGDALRGTMGSGTQRVTIGTEISTPQARLHLPAGGTDANTGAFRMSTGSLLTSPANGVFEFDGTDLYFTVGTTRKKFTLVDA